MQLNPSTEGRKYLNYAEMLAGRESVQMYLKGIDVLNSDLKVAEMGGVPKEDVLLIKRQIASAFASIAELYMTDPLW